MSFFVGDIGDEITYLITAGRSNVGATVLQFEVVKPDGSIVIWDAANLSSDTTNMTLYYKIVDGDLDQAGDYRITPYREFSDGAKHHCDRVFLAVVAP